jgi:RNA polymerase sigma factor for flagellar operon FliA
MSAPRRIAQQDQWIEQCQGLVRSLAVQIHRKLPASIELDDLIAYGQLGLVEAAHSYDSSRGCQFSTYAYYRIRGSIYDGAAKMTWGLRDAPAESRGPPECETQTQRPSGERATAEEASGEERALARHREATHAVAVISLSRQSKDDSESEPGGLVDTSQTAPPATAMESEMSEKLRELIDMLPQSAAALIRATYFEGLTLEEAGQRLGLTKSGASRARSRALQSLARSLDSWEHA